MQIYVNVSPNLIDLKESFKENIANKIMCIFQGWCEILNNENLEKSDN